MLAHHFILIMTIWIGVSLILLSTSAYFAVQMRNHRVPKERPLFETKSAVYFSSPDNFTETGLAYRRKAFQVQLAIGGWMLFAMIVGHYL